MNKVNDADISTSEIDSIYEKMTDEKLRFTDGLIDEIIEYTAEDINLSETDVVDLAVATLHSIIVLSNNPIAVNGVKSQFDNIIGDSAETINYLNDLLSGISATDDSIADGLIETAIDDAAVDGGAVYDK